MSFRHTATRLIYRGEKVSLELHCLRDESGRRLTKEVCRHPGAVCILALGAEDTILLIRNRRWPLDGKVLLELPAGTLGAGEEPAACAARELEEETGFAAESIEPLAEFYTAPGILGERMYVFLARDLRPTRMAREPGEELEVVPTTFEKALQQIDSGELIDAKSICALLMYDRQRRSR